MQAPDYSGRSLHDLIDLAGRSAVITGGARGIGLAIARRLAEAKACVIIADRDSEAAREAAEILADEFNTLVLGIGVDVTDAAAVADLAAEAAYRVGTLDIWINNAGVYPPQSFLDMTEAQWDEVQNVNLRGAFVGAREAAIRMRPPSGRGGVILSVASVSGLRGRANLAHYTASKHGLVGLTKALGIELAPMNIRVLAVAPTLIETPGVTEARADTQGDSGDAYRAFVARVEASIPLGRVGVADDIARVALFCVSGLAGYMTGVTIPVDGGATA